MSRKLMPTISILLLIAMLVLVGTNGATIANCRLRIQCLLV